MMMCNKDVVSSAAYELSIKMYENMDFQLYRVIHFVVSGFKDTGLYFTFVKCDYQIKHVLF